MIKCCIKTHFSNGRFGLNVPCWSYVWPTWDACLKIIVPLDCVIVKLCGFFHANPYLLMRYFFRSFGNTVSRATANRMRAAPVMLMMLYGSPKRAMPTTMAVRGSKAPSMATIVLSISLSDAVTQMLLKAVGTRPSRIRLIQHELSEIASTFPLRHHP